MTIIGSTQAGAAYVDVPTDSGKFLGLATGMFIDPCVVFPAGATITDLQVGASEAFATSVNAAQESYAYAFNVREIEVIYLRCAATSSLVAQVGDAPAALVVLLGVSADSSVICLIEGLVGMCAALGITSVSELKCAASLSSTRALGLGFESTHSLTCAANLQVTRAVELGFMASPQLVCKASLKVTRAESLGFARSHSLTAKATLKLAPVILLSIETRYTYSLPRIIWDTRFSWWAFDDETDIYPHRNPIYRENIHKSETSGRAVLTIS